ncbi:MAG TPA: c-type cytochrome [Bryobacteraceae bacterium]|jgi:mono/diheme cytochrome c family protein
MRTRALVAATAFACALFAETRYEAAEAVFARAPQKARARRNPLETNALAAVAGKKLFEQHCAECHGAMEEGSRRGPALRDEAVGRAAPGEIFWVLTNGVVRKGMPAWAKLPEGERWQIVRFLGESGAK